MHYYKRIKELREQKQWTQKDIAEKLGLKQPHYYRYESGERDIPTELLIKIADTFETSTDYILGRTNNPRQYLSG